ncbi:MAG TPA: right-handed parallel beta-helix repeat-containing protein [Candidatus Eisenbacteria bacterium]|nr:right-handed parallel beta-helix repeat-containing protein [Candidatus Eisenbacteria bacterium]
MLAAAFGPGAAWSATLAVPGQWPTVRAAVDTAATGDTILIAPGVHPGGVYIKSKVLTLASWFILTGDTSYVSQTVIDSVVGAPCTIGCAGNAVLEFKDADGSRVVGLTLQHGEDGVRSHSVVDIAFCRIIRNADGIDYQSGSGGLIRNSLFAWNTDDGVDINGRTTVQVIGNLMYQNHQDGVEFRLYPYTGPPLLCEFAGNLMIENHGDGLQLIDYPDTSSRVVRIEHNYFRGNGDASIGCLEGITSENFSGAPIPERVYLINNTFHGTRYGFVGGANVIGLNNLFVDTQQSALRRVGGNSINAYDLFWDNETNYEDSNLDWPNLLYNNPDIGPGGALDEDSPAIDAGTAFYQWQGETVLDLPPSAYVGSAPDIGAFERGGVFPTGNTPPVVDAGADRTVALNVATLLDATVFDDWLPNPVTLDVTWTMVSGPDSVTFQDCHAVDTWGTFAVAGDYVLRLTACDGALDGIDSVHITVQPGPPPGALTVERRIDAASDDQEEQASGIISPNTNDLELVIGPTVQKVGLRFTEINIPPGSVITRAWIQFEADEVQTDPTTLFVQAQAADNPPTFTFDPFNVSSRARTVSEVTWTPLPWLRVGAQTSDERTPDLSALVQEIVNRPGWAGGNAMAFIISGSGHRTARSWEGKPSGAALLHIEATAQVTGVGDPPRSGPLLRGVFPNPSRGTMRVDLSLADGPPATLDLIDLAGRRVTTRDLASFGGGNHSVELREALPVGVYFIRLAQARQARVMKVAIIK